MEPDPSLPNDGAIVWNGVTGSGAVQTFEPIPVFDVARSRPGNPEVIIFHPRTPPGIGGGFSAISGQNYFMGDERFQQRGRRRLRPRPPTRFCVQTLILKPGGTGSSGWSRSSTTAPLQRTNKTTAGSTRKTQWTKTPVVEIGTVDDWFGLLNSDERDGMFAVGSSDSHSVMSGSPVGNSERIRLLDRGATHAIPRSHSSVAQLVERATVNRLVIGSSPIAGASSEAFSRARRPFLFLRCGQGRTRTDGVLTALHAAPYWRWNSAASRNRTRNCTIGCARAPD